MEFVYKNLKGNYEKLLVTEEEVNRQMVRLQQQNQKTVQVTDRAAQSGDEIVLDYAGYCDGVAFEGGTAEMQTLLLGSGMFIPGFEEQLMGCAIGEDVTVKVTFPTDYHAEQLAGKDAEFRCKIHEIHVKTPYELDDTFAKEVGECENLEQMRQYVADSLQEYYDNQSDKELEDALMRQASMTLECSFTDAEMEQALDAQMQDLEAQLNRNGLTLDAYCQFTGSDKNKIREDMRPDAEYSLRIQKTAETIADLEGLKADAQDVADECELLCRQNGMTMEQLQPYYTPEFAAILMKNIRMKKAIRLVRENAQVTVTEKEAKPE